MPDREKVKAELDEIVEQCRGMGYIGFSTITEHCQNILALLKEQEAIEPVKIPWLHSDGSVSEKYRCGSCDLSIFPSYKFCPFCGQAVKWE